METRSRFDELEERISVLETHLRVARIVGALTGLTFSGLLVVLLHGYQKIDSKLDHAQQQASMLARKVDADVARHDQATAAMQLISKQLNASVDQALKDGERQITELGARRLKQVADDIARIAPPAAVVTFLQLQNQWAVGDSSRNGDPRAMRTKDGMVILQGAVTSGHGVITVLPEGYRPTSDFRTSAACFGDQPCMVQIAADGRLWCNRNAPWVSLDGVSFVAAPSSVAIRRPASVPGKKPAPVAKGEKHGA